MAMLHKRKLQIFVSSTYTDLIEERQMAVSAILKAGHIPAGMELFTSGDKSQLDVIKRWIDESDVYMLILGTKYGSIEPIGKLSYTETEYDHAVGRGKPFFALVMGESAMDKKLAANASAYLEKNEPQKYKNFREKVLSKICSIYEDPSQIRAHIYESIIDITSTLELVGWVKGDLIVDTKPLYEQIASLTAANESLQAELDDRRLLASSRNNTGSKDFENLDAILKSIRVTIPAEHGTDGKDAERSIYQLFVGNRNLLVRGYNINKAKPRSVWYFNNVYTVLATHRLVNIMQTGIMTHVSATERGLDYLAWYDEMRALSANKVNKASPS